MTALRNLRRSFLTAIGVGGVLVVGFTNQALANTASADPTVAIQASPSGFPAGTAIFGAATLGQGDSPTGTITFTLFGPADPTCAGAPLFVSDVAVTGNAYHQSAMFPTNAAGTYRWTARYNGDTDNNPTARTACSDPAAAVIVSKRNPTLASTAANGSAGISNAATLGSGSGASGPTGTITFAVYGAGNMTCAGSPVFTSVEAVAGNGTYTSDPYRPTTTGTFQWTVTYSGDANNNATATGCADPANAVTVSSTSSTSTSSTSTSSGSPGSTATGPRVSVPASVRGAEYLSVSWSGIASPTTRDWYALYAVGASDSTVVAWRYTNGQGSGTSSIKVPFGTRPGSYEVRLFANNSTQRLAVSTVITVA